MANKKLKNRWFVLSLLLLSTFYFLLSTSVEAAKPLQLQVQFPCPDFPGAACPTGAKEKAGESPAAYIARLYQFALAIAGMLAFGMIIFGAIQYTVSAGNVAQQSDARDRIFQALWGVALLLGAYLILYTIDPKLVSLTDPDIGLLEIKAPPGNKTNYTQREGVRCYPDAGVLCEKGKGLACEKENDYYVCKKIKISTGTEKPAEDADLTYVRGVKCPDGFKIEALKTCMDQKGLYDPKGPTPICCKRK